MSVATAVWYVGAEGDIMDVGDEILVPSSRIGLSDAPFALVMRKVQGLEHRSVVVDGPAGETVKVATRFVWDAFSVLVVRFGDFQTESSLLDPMTDAIEKYLSLLVEPDHLDVVRLRTSSEFENRASFLGGKLTHIVLIGHSDGEGFALTDGTALRGEELVSAFGGGPPMTILSLACRSGRANLGKEIAGTDRCKEYLAPYQDIHGGVAISACIRYFAELLVIGADTAVAARRGLGGLPSGLHFRRFVGADKWDPL